MVGVALEGDDGCRPPLARRGVFVLSAAVVAILVGVSWRYGYHRDELYFLAAGRRLAWGYPDQPPLVPLLSRAMSALAPGSLLMLRLPSALAAGAVVGFTAASAREVGAGPRGQLLAGGAMAIAPALLGLGHQLNTAVFGVAAWTVVLWLVVRILRSGEQRGWLAVGVVAGVGLQASTLVVFVLGGIVAGLLVSGPRRVFTSPWLWAGGLVALLLWAPYLAWQATHGWPQLEVSQAIAAGASGTSESRLAFVPYQLLLVGVWLAPIWITGLVRLLRDPALRWCRALGWTYLFVGAVFIAAGGKPYYLVGMYPLLFAAGAQPTLGWARSCGRWRPATLGAALVLSAPGAVFALPVLPLHTFGDLGLASVNYDLGEQVGWPTYVEQIAAVYRDLPAERRPATILTSNYGQAGAVDHYRATMSLPSAFSGHMGYWHWGPPAGADTVIAVGFDRDDLHESFADCQFATRLRNQAGVDNDEHGTPVWICTGLRAPWTQLWPRFRRT